MHAFGIVKMIYTMIRKLFISFLCVASLGFAANAQAPEDGGVMTLHDCMAYAVSNSTKMRIQQAAIGDAQIDRRDAALKHDAAKYRATSTANRNDDGMMLGTFGFLLDGESQHVRFSLRADE